MLGNCCVFQPFDDGGPYDKRYDEVISPAIKAANLEPYRVDRDASAEIPIDKLHEEICRSAVCLADITSDNPNIWYELGFAVASDPSIVMICQKGRKLPFNMHHRSVIFYTLDSPKDFKQLKNDITSRLKAALEKKANVQRVVAGSPVKAPGGLGPHQIAVMALIIENRDDENGCASLYQISDGMKKAGYNKVAISVALASLTRREEYVDTAMDEFETPLYWLTPQGEEWVLANQNKLELRVFGAGSEPSRRDKYRR